MRIRKESPTYKIFKAIKFLFNEVKNSAYYMGPGFSAFLSRKSIGEVLSAMPGYKSSQTNFEQNCGVSFSRLKKKGFIKFSDKDKFVLTDKGKDILLKFDVDDVKLPDFNPKKWDSIWRVLIFDIPELTRVARNIFRDKIQELEFYTLQKSVYVTPIACEKEIFELARILKIGSAIVIIHASKLGQKEPAVKRFFGID